MNRAEFAQKYFKLDPAFLSDNLHQVFRVWGRSTGKTTTGLAACLHTALEGKDAIFYAPSFSRALLSKNEFNKQVPEWVKDFHIAEDKGNEIIFKHGGSIKFLAGDTTKGLAADLIYVEDWRDVSDIDETKRALTPVIAARKGILFGLTS